MIQYILMAVFCLGVVGLDQWTKYLVVHNIAHDICDDAMLCAEHAARLKSTYHISDDVLAHLPKQIDGIPGIFQLTHIHNTGAAFSSFEGQHWLFALVLAFFAGFIIWEFPKKRLAFTNFERWLIVSIFAGGIGNMIDRLRLGFVIDMIDLEFAQGTFLANVLNNFAVFNVADIFISCSCVLLLVHLFLFNKTFWKEEKK